LPRSVNISRKQRKQKKKRKSEEREMKRGKTFVLSFYFCEKKERKKKNKKFLSGLSPKRENICCSKEW
jgi:hypothetical protein